ncbi:hypothetical protein [Pseudotabrizicola algicola]|uniref:Uncharacterized protein n=1 Tax=Pseudotabrizicola algicola TaxID=2709381 RepID=A0A6B3RTW3_9RHOB|nr:hypothetical protein [Pseudotabrizicola algicola]NEX46489.1 hypothetical protein [Pseudotabrizicola algicola]
MMRTLALAASVAALPALAPAYAQTAGNDLPAAETWWDRVGAGFFSDEGLTLLRPEFEIRAHWTALSSDDQAAILERCAILADRADVSDTSGAVVPSQQQGSNTGLGDTQDAQATGSELPADEGVQREATAPTSISGAADGAEVHRPSEGVQPYTGLAGGVTPDDAQLRPVCSVVAGI